MMMMNKKTARKKGMHRQNIIKYWNILLTEDLFFCIFRLMSSACRYTLEAYWSLHWCTFNERTN